MDIKQFVEGVSTDTIVNLELCIVKLVDMRFLDQIQGAGTTTFHNRLGF